MTYMTVHYDHWNEAFLHDTETIFTLVVYLAFILHDTTISPWTVFKIFGARTNLPTLTAVRDFWREKLLNATPKLGIIDLWNASRWPFH